MSWGRLPMLASILRSQQQWAGSMKHVSGQHVHMLLCFSPDGGWLVRSLRSSLNHLTSPVWPLTGEGEARKLISRVRSVPWNLWHEVRTISFSATYDLVKAMVFPVVMCGCESWTVKKAEHQRIDAFELWYWRRLLRVPWTARRSNQSILTEISPGILWKECCWSWNSSTLATSWEELTHRKRLWCWETLGAGEEGDDRGWDGWMASRTQWMWVWVNSRSWWWTGMPGVLRFMGSQRVGHNWVTELNWTGIQSEFCSQCFYFFFAVHSSLLASLLFWLPFFVKCPTGLSLKDKETTPLQGLLAVSELNYKCIDQSLLAFVRCELIDPCPWGITVIDIL